MLGCHPEYSQFKYLKLQIFLNMKTKIYSLAFLLSLSLFACNSSSGGGGSILPGLYTGSVVYRDHSGSNSQCLDWVKQCFQLSQIQISEQFHTDNSSYLIVESNVNSDILGIAPPNASSIDFTEALSDRGTCGQSSNRFSCSGVRKSMVQSVSSQDRVIHYTGEITASCTSNDGSFACKIDEEGYLQQW